MTETERKDGIDIISFKTDRINALNVDVIRPVIMKLFETPYTKVVIDMEGVNYLDSTAFAMFLYLLRVARSNYCTYRICSLTQGAGELFELLQLHQSLDIYPDRESCLESFRNNSPY
ncbi:MAG: STAS domain-containing protein [Bacteroidales bacterium]|jgi:anti-anti-sigma factor|nr:STAS domain-containing protein [Bacteroidales bacterium]